MHGISCRLHAASWQIWPAIHFVWDVMPTSCGLVPSMAGDLLCMGFHAGLMRYCAQCGRRFTLYGIPWQPLSGLVPVWPVIHSVRDFMTTACGFVTSMAGDSFLYGISCRPHAASCLIWPADYFVWEFMPTSFGSGASMAGDSLCTGFHDDRMRLRD